MIKIKEIGWVHLMMISEKEDPTSKHQVFIFFFSLFLNKKSHLPLISGSGSNEKMGTGEALKHICSKLKASHCVQRLVLDDQAIDDSGVLMIIDMLKVNSSIKKLNLGLLVF